jgi:putative DNA primase/helicase
MAVTKEQRFTKSDPCPVCGGSQGDKSGRCWGFFSLDRTYAHCTNDTGSGLVPYSDKTSTYQHALGTLCLCGTEHTASIPSATPTRTQRAPSVIDAVYDYVDARGVSRFQSIRFEPKDFRQRHMGRDGKWIWNLDCVTTFLYRLPELLNNPDRLVYVVEGEKDVETLRAQGYIATCNPMGAGKWKTDYNETLRGRDVVIIPDNDPEFDDKGRPHHKGQKHAQAVAMSLQDIAASVKLVFLPVDFGKDVSDFFAHGGTCAELDGITNATPLFDAPPKEAITFPRTELGNAQRLVARCGEDLRYCYAWKTWMLWNGKYWQEDDYGAIMRRAKETVRAIFAEAEKASDDEAREIVKFAMASQSAKALKALVELAQSELPITPLQFDTDPWLFNCQNGTLNLKTGQLLAHQRGHFITKISAVNYDANAHNEIWESYIVSVMDGNQDLITFLQRAAGYSLTGDTSEEVFFFLHGPESAGKSTFLDAIKAVLGSYAQVAQFETFMQRRDTGGPREDLATMIGARFVSASEGNRGQRFDHAVVKQITGGDHVRARRLYSASFEFKPAFKLWLAANDAPKVHDDDNAMWRRLLRIPFEHPPEKKDPHVKATLCNPQLGGPAILAWMMCGCLDWQRDGLAIPGEVRAATQAYKQDMDPLQDFLQEVCIMHTDAFVPSKTIFSAYTTWCKENNLHATMTQKMLSDRITKKGFFNATNRYQNRVERGFFGIGLRSDATEEMLESVTDQQFVTDLVFEIRYTPETRSAQGYKTGELAVTDRKSESVSYTASHVESFVKNLSVTNSDTPPSEAQPSAKAVTDLEKRSVTFDNKRISFAENVRILRQNGMSEDDAIAYVLAQRESEARHLQ